LIILGDVAIINPAKAIPRAKTDVTVSFLSMKAVEVESGRFDLSETIKLSDGLKRFTLFQDGDIIFAKITPCMENGKIALMGGLRNGIGLGSTEFHVIRLPDCVDNKFYFYFLLQASVRRFLRGRMTGTAGQLRVPTKELECLTVPVVSYPEQKRIVAKIESLFSRLDSAKDSLERVQQEIKRYRQAVFKSAFEKIEQEKPIESIFKIIDYRGRTPPYADKGVIHLRTSNIRNGQIRLENIRYVTEETYKKYMTRGIPHKGDVLMTTEAPMGEVSLIPDYKFSIAQRMVLLRSDNFDKFVMYQIMSTFFQKRLERAKTGTTVAGISSRNFKKVPFKFCSPEEQVKIVENIESRFERAKLLEDAVEQGLEKIERLKQSILKKAFEGKLVEPDPNDEPVESLLERIKKGKLELSKK